jgi:hypothetical protein
MDTDAMLRKKPNERKSILPLMSQCKPKLVPRRVGLQHASLRQTHFRSADHASK